MKKPKPSLFLFVFLLFLLTTLTNPLSVSAQPLSVTVSTGKTLYELNEDIYIHANLTSDGSPIQDGLVALQVDNPAGWPLIYRTLQTDTPPPPTQLEILNVTPCDMGGNPKNSFEKQTLAWFQIYYNNTSPNTINVTFTFTIYDNETVPLGDPQDPEAWLYVPGVYRYKTSIPIPDYASLGTARVYVNAYTDRPKLGGVPYCPEVSARFEITESQTQGESQSTVTGPYNTTFKLSSKANHKVGNYTAYVSSSYQGQNASSNTTFEVILRADVNGDKVVDFWDLMAVAAPGVYEVPNSATTYPERDVNNDGSIDFWDLMAIAAPGVYDYDGRDP